MCRDKDLRRGNGLLLTLYRDCDLILHGDTMSVRPTLSKSGATVWWILGCVIAVPALILAILGIRAVRTDHVEREQDARRQQRQVVQLADASLTTMLSDIEIELSQFPADTVNQEREQQSPSYLRIRYEKQGLIVFPGSKTYFGDIGVRPVELDSLTQWPGSVAELIEQAQGAEIQGHPQEASRLYRRVAQEEPRLTVWAERRLYRIRNRRDPPTPANISSSNDNMHYGALTPTGLPVALLASAEIDVVPESNSDIYLPQVRRVMQHVRSGMWWLSQSERQFYHSLLQRLVSEIDTSQTVVHDDALAELASVEAALRLSTPTRRDRTTHAFVVNENHAFLIIWSPAESGPDEWNGVVFNQANLDARLDRILSPLLSEQPFETELRDASNRHVWGSFSTGRAELQRVGSRVVREWEYVFGGLIPSAFRSDVISYGVIALLIVMMLSGLAVTVRGVRREMTLGKLQNEFVSAVSHEFKSPITGVRLLVERLSTGKELTTEQSHEYFSAIDSELNRLERLVNRVLMVQKLQTGHLPYQFVQTSVAVVIERAANLIRPQAEAKQISIIINPDKRMPNAEIDESSITDAIENLLDNAVKYSSNGSTVSIRTELIEDFVVVEVSDEGPGIKPDDRERIFEKFFRGEAADQHDVRGTGLGLALVKAVVEDHHGTIHVRSGDSGGSCFQMMLPIHQPESDNA